MMAFNPNVGDLERVKFSTISTTDIVKYSCASGDFNPLHFDHLYAMSRGLDGVVAHGMLSMGLCASGIAKTFGQEVWLKNLEVRFTAPVYAGMSIDIEYEVLKRLPEKEWLVGIRAFVEGNDIITGTATVVLLSD